ncbi:MAG: MFS transporter [Catenulispora sp.]
MVSGTSAQSSAEPTGGSASRGRDFRLFWLGGAANLFGSNASALAMPILVLALGGSALTAGAVGTVEATVQVVLTPICGVFADRGSRRALMTGALLVAALATGAVAVGAGFHALSLPLVFACVVVGGAATSVYSAAATASIRSLLPEQEPEKAIGSLQAREQGAKLAGPGIGGALYQLAAWVPFLVDAVSFVFAALCARAIRTDLRPVPAAEPSAERPPGFRREIADGLSFLWRQPFLRFVALWAGSVNLLIGALSFAVIVAARLSGATAGQIGLVLTLAGAAGLAGALAAPLVLRRVRAGVVVIGASWATAAVLVPLAVWPSLVTDAVALVLLGLLAPVLSIIFQSKAVMLIPDGLQGRVGTALGTLAEGTGALAPLAAGALVRVLSPSTLALLFIAGLALLAGYATLSAPLLRSAPPADPTTDAQSSEAGGDGSDTAPPERQSPSPEPYPVPAKG